MRAILSWLATLALTAAIGFLAFTLILPNVMMSFALNRVERGSAPSVQAAGANGTNRMYHSQLVDERYGADSNYLFTRPNPDILYSGCSFDLSAGPVLVEMPAHEEYGSIALHATNTDNFAVYNNRARPKDPLSVLVVASRSEVPTDYSGNIAVSPTKRGMALVRLLTEKRGQMPRYLALQRQHRCAVLKQSS
jgi:uncharacterized membrane protein